MKRNLLYLNFCALSLLFFQCAKEHTVSVKENDSRTISSEFSAELELSFTPLDDDSSFTSNKSTTTTSTSIKEKANSILLSINDVNGNSIYENHTVKLVRVGEDILSIPLSFTATGTYFITLFQVLDENNVALAMTPRINTPLSSIVTTTLDYPFTVETDITQRINLDVVTINASYNAEDFGYSTFSFTEVNLTTFRVGVFSYNNTSTNFELISSTITLTHLATNETVHSETYSASTALIPLPLYADEVIFELNVASTGYSSHISTITYKELLNHQFPRPNGEGPIIIILNKIPDDLPIEVFTFKGNEYGVVTNPLTGRTWLDRNLGANRVAIASTDTQSFGDLYQWGRATDGHEKRFSSITRTISNSDKPGHGSFILESPPIWDWRVPRNDSLWQGVTGTNNPCPKGYRLPTIEELNTERNSWPFNNSEGAYQSPLKLPYTGYRSGTGYAAYTVGYYWSSSPKDSRSSSMYFTNNDARISMESVRVDGYCVRCIKD